MYLNRIMFSATLVLLSNEYLRSYSPKTLDILPMTTLNFNLASHRSYFTTDTESHQMFGCDIKKSKLVDDQMIISFALTKCPLVLRLYHRKSPN